MNPVSRTFMLEWNILASLNKIFTLEWNLLNSLNKYMNIFWNLLNIKKILVPIPPTLTFVENAPIEPTLVEIDKR